MKPIADPSDALSPGTPCTGAARLCVAAAVLVAIALGAAWGTLLFWRIGTAGSFTGVSIHEVNAHGHAAVAGFVGLFAMGSACALLPRWWNVALPAPWFGRAAAGALLAGIAASCAGSAVAAAEPRLGGILILGGGELELLGFAAFAALLAAAFRRSSARLDAASAFVFAALALLLAQGVLGTWHAHRVATALDRGELLRQVATYQAPVRDLQLHGFALLFLLGLSLRLVPERFGRPAVPPRRARAALALIALGVAGEVVLFVAYRRSGSHWLAALLLLPWLAIASSALAIGCTFRPWRAWRGDARGGPFLRAAWLWLALSFLLLLGLPGYLAATGIAFSHAYYAAVRNAFAIGFVTLTIVGIAECALAPPCGDAGRRTAPRGPFLLLNAGCLLCVALPIATDRWPAIHAGVGAGGILAFLGLAGWGLPFVRSLWKAADPGAGARCGGAAGALSSPQGP